MTDDIITDCETCGAVERIAELEAENEKLRAAGEGVVKWWLDEGCLPFDGAPYALFALRKALGDSRAKAALGAG